MYSARSRGLTRVPPAVGSHAALAAVVEGHRALFHVRRMAVPGDGRRAFEADSKSRSQRGDLFDMSRLDVAVQRS